ncbi:hypothetical protein EVAR_96776_1 [Eumeta japonica]|uniref:Uncharacterized protein n=1 Tax=Eumeta variegata TaxID=151549 RepID=A0A4C1WUH1_EUMVA|nr:hypothetical protein EVAR_96776_1 [Eumeta japonica]
MQAIGSYGVALALLEGEMMRAYGREWVAGERMWRWRRDRPPELLLTRRDSTEETATSCLYSVKVYYLTGRADPFSYCSQIHHITNLLLLRTAHPKINRATSTRPAAIRTRHLLTRGRRPSPLRHRRSHVNTPMNISRRTQKITSPLRIVLTRELPRLDRAVWTVFVNNKSPVRRLAASVGVSQNTPSPPPRRVDCLTSNDVLRNYRIMCGH